MRSLATPAAPAIALLASLASGGRADPLGDPLAGPLAGPPDPLAALIGPALLCAAPAPAALPWCAPAPPAARPPTPAARPAEPGAVAISSKQAHDPSSLKADQVASKIQSAYLAGVRRCYRDALARRPGLRGALRLDFTVNAVGKTEAFSVKGVDEVAGCAGKLVATWRFPIPQSTYAEPRTARFTIVLALAP